MNFRLVWTKHFRYALWTMGIAVQVGCHSAQLPNAPELSPPDEQTTDVAIAKSAPLRIALKPFALSKPTGKQTASSIVEKTIDSSGGKMTIAHEKTLTDFVVPNKALDQPVVISMQILGSGPSAVVELGPDGLHFDRPSILAITFPNKDVDPDDLGGYLVHEDGSVTPVPYKILVKRNRITIIMLVSHFSQYGSDEGEENNAATIDYSYCHENYCVDDWQPYQPGY